MLPFRNLPFRPLALTDVLLAQSDLQSATQSSFVIDLDCFENLVGQGSDSFCVKIVHRMRYARASG